MTLYQWARDEGFKHHTARALNLLASYLRGEHNFEKNPKVFAKMKKLNIITPDGKVVFELEPDDGVEWILFGLVYEGYVERIVAEA